MKTVQHAVTLLVVVGLVFGVAFFWQYLSGPAVGGKSETGPKTSLVTGPEKPLLFAGARGNSVIVEWQPKSAGDFELHTTGHHDFWFVNPHDAAVKLWVKGVNCKCARIEGCTLSAETARQFRRWQFASGLFPVLQAHNGLPTVLSQLIVDETATRAALGLNLNWEGLLVDKKDNTSLVVPPQGAGIVRVFWEAKEVGLKRVTAELHTQPQSGGPSPITKVELEVPTKLVDAVRCDPPLAVQLGDLGGRESREAVIWCWSSAYAAFNATARVLNRDRQPDSCFVCAVRPMTEAERENLAGRLESRVLCGYRIGVTVHERVTDRQMLELGPFMRRLQVVTDLMPEPTGPLLQGVVRGEVQVGTPDDGDRIDLKSFPAERGTQKEVPVATEPGSDLLTGPKDIEWSPDFLEVQLVPRQPAKDGSGSVWALRVKVPPGRAFGPLPATSAVYLQLRGNPPRRILIPVQGNAYVK
jgi:hypothetical protein